ncbi:ABC transporter permease [Plantibacter sp. VKM Ac-2880]|uniref:ABC transporter permease n=1 Tax=Plantibacter sp. VKM Ac-2880 TaxID=2783827 RepID=UPI00188F4157|nr:ABC transporter permease [Plantibacter sp. VKM Ac-2880]MBF4570408.1 ABC transporter permease [Plantibacter sp. VKM Ac-2880]
MFVAWRDMRFATGRFVLIGAVVTLITLLVGFLSGLTAGLANQNISAITGLGASSIVLAGPADGGPATYADSAIDDAAATRWAAVPGVDHVLELGISQTRLTTAEARTAVALFGTADVTATRSTTDAPADGTARLSRTAAEALHVSRGDTVSIGAETLTVGAVVDDQWYSHTPVVWTSLATWRSVQGASGAPTDGATALALSGTLTADAVTAAEHATGTVSEDVLSSLLAIGSFRSEIGSLLLMVGMLFGISALVIGAFFTVWTMQRAGDVAILKALGATTGRLALDALGQASVLLLLGVGLGIGLTAVLGSAAGSALPFVLSPLTTLLPGVVMIGLGLVGAAFALRSILSADPLTALGGNR